MSYGRDILLYGKMTANNEQYELQNYKRNGSKSVNGLRYFTPEDFIYCCQLSQI